MEAILNSDNKCSGLKEISIDDLEIINKYTSIREIESCEYSLTTLFMWKKMYNPHLYIDDNYMIIFENYEDECYALMPLCSEEYFVESFAKAVEIFKDIEEEFEMYCVDEAYARVIENTFAKDFKVIADRSIADYIYSGDSLRNLSGKKLRKKKNHINAFKRINEDNYEFRILTGNDKEEIMGFLRNWCLQHGELSEHLQEEIEGINYILDHVDVLDSKVAGVMVAGKLEAITIGSYINNKREAVIHVEKANSDIRGLYPFINQQFLLEVFPEVELVNREDDLDIEGLRKAKMSYEPLRLEAKYTITPK